MKLSVRNIFCLFFSLGLLSNSKSQSLHVGGLFPTIDHSGTLTNKLDYSIYYFGAFPMVNLPKTQDPYFHLLYLEQALTYKVTSAFSVTGSYVYQQENVLSSHAIHENRFYIQAKYKHPLNARINLTMRLRFDGRFINDGVSAKIPFTHRLRYLIGIDRPINKKLYFTAYEEAFFNTFKNASKVYGENWAYIALGKKINERNKLEAGILYVTWNVGSNNWFNQYYGQFTWISNLDFRKKKK